jgi:hypothetical protein
VSEFKLEEVKVQNAQAEDVPMKEEEVKQVQVRI